MNREKINEAAAKLGMNIIIKYKYLCMIFIVLLTLFGYMGTERLVMDSSNESLFSESDAIVEMNKKFKEIFGNEEFVFILVEADDVFDYEVLNGIRTLSNDLKENLPFVKDVLSLTEIEYIDARGENLIIEDLIKDEIPEDQKSIEEIRSKALSKDLYLNKIITQNSRMTGLIINFQEIPYYVYLPVDKGFSPLDEAEWPHEKIILQDRIFFTPDAGGELELSKVADARKLIAPALNVILERNRNEKFRILSTGLPVVDYATDKTIMNETSKVSLISLITSLVLLIIIFKSLTAIIAPFIVIILTNIIVFGLMGWLGMPIAVTSIVIIPLLLVISVSYSIHIINHFRHHYMNTGSRNASVEYAFEHSTWPCFITSVTTALGFASFMVVPIVPIRNLGLICSIGVFITYVLVITLVPIFLSFGGERSKNSAANEKQEEKNTFVIKWADFVLRKPAVTVAVFLAVSISMLYFSTKIRVDTQLTEMFGEKIQFVKNSKYIADNLGGIYSFEVMVELPEENMATDPNVLLTLETIENRIKKWPSVKMTFSILDIIKDLNKTMNRNNSDYFRVPDTKEQISQYLLLYEISGGSEIEDWMDNQFKILRLSVQSSAFSSAMEDKFNEIIAYGRKTLPEGTTISITGDVPILMKTIHLLSVGQIQSIFAAFLVITILMIFILKSLKVGLISMIPNTLPVFVISGIMGMLDIPLDLVTIMIAPTIIGIAVDDTVHYFVHFNQEYDKCGDYREANRETFNKIGKALLFTSIVLVFGFGVFVVSDIVSLLNLALLSSAGIITALLADLFVTPVLFVYLKPFGKRQ